MLVTLLGQLAAIIMVDLVLAGDNAVVIGMAARGLPPEQRRKAILWGSVAAVGLRLTFATVMTLLLGIPLLSAVGGVLLFWIARKIVQDENGHRDVAAGSSLWEAVKIIILADVIMSLDNVLALAGVAHGHVGLLALGLAITVPLIVWGSTLVSALMNRLPWLLWVGVGVLIWTGAGMILHDRVVHGRLPEPLAAVATYIQVVVTVAATGLLWLEQRRRRRPERAEATPEGPDGV